MLEGLFSGGLVCKPLPRATGRRTRRQLIDAVMQAQPEEWHPDAPCASLAFHFYHEVLCALGDCATHELRIYIAFNSPLDRFHGIDFFFVWKEKVVSIDITARPSKAKYKADFLLTEEVLKDRIRRRKLAGEIACAFGKKTSEEWRQAG